VRVDFVWTHFRSKFKYSTTWGVGVARQAIQISAKIRLDMDETLTLSLSRRDERVRRRLILVRQAGLMS
jgi:hypothetical protein